MSIIRDISAATAEYAVNRYVRSRNPKTRRRHDRRYFDCVFSALSALCERLRYKREEALRN